MTTRVGVALLLFVMHAMFVSYALADDFGAGDIEPTTPVTGYSIKRATPSTTPAPTIPPTTAQNILPIANAGPNQTVVAGALVILNASESRDSDGSIVSYEWKQLSGPPVEILSHRTKHASFTAGDIAATYIFGVTVRDANGAVSTDLATIVVRPQPVISVTPTPVIVIPSPVASVPFSFISLPITNLVFIALGGILLLLVGVVIKVALRRDGT